MHRSECERVWTWIEPRSEIVTDMLLNDDIPNWLKRTKLIESGIPECQEMIALFPDHEESLSLTVYIFEKLHQKRAAMRM